MKLYFNFHLFYFKIIAVCGSQSKNNSMLILNEAFRLNLMPTLADLKTGNFTIEKMEEIIRVD